MQRKYQEMRLIFTPGISQPKGISRSSGFDLQNSEIVDSSFNYDNPAGSHLKKIWCNIWPFQGTLNK